MFEQNQNLNSNQVPASPMPVAPMTDNTISVEQVTISQPKRKWWLIILISVFGILIIGGGAYAFLFADLKNKLPFFSKPVENFSEVVNPEPVVENTPTVNVELQDALQNLTAPIILCLDQKKELSQPVSSALICEDGDSVWPTLIDDYKWSTSYGGDPIQMTWNYCIYHTSDPDIFCDQTGCKQSNCQESILSGKKNINEQLANQLDTDQDGLTDDEELNIYQTDIINPDSDSDGYQDGDEVKNGYNPLGKGILEINEKFFDKLPNLVKYSDVKFLKFNIFNVPNSQEKFGTTKKFPLTNGSFANMSETDQVSNAGTVTMMYMKDHLDLFPGYNDLFSQYVGMAGDGTDVTAFSSYYAYSFVIAYPSENSICDYESGEMALRQGLIAKNGDVYFFGGACVNNKNEITNAKGYIWNL